VCEWLVILIDFSEWLAGKLVIKSNINFLGE